MYIQVILQCGLCKFSIFDFSASEDLFLFWFLDFEFGCSTYPV